MTRLGLMCGTFDPPHVGHLLLAETAVQQVALDRVLFMPVGQPTHKTTTTAARHRCAMTALAIAADDRFEIDTTDVERDPPHYTTTLLPHLLAKRPGTDFWLLLGGDSARDLPTWYRPDHLLRQCRPAVLPRPGAPFDIETINRELPAFGKRTTILQGPSIHVSSTYLRTQAAHGRLSRYLIPETVRDYIAEHNLYAD